MKKSTEEYLLLMFERYPALKQCEQQIIKAYECLLECYRNGNKVMVCGNGGSAADAEHIVGELMKGFLSPRKLNDEQKNIIKKSYTQDSEYLTENLQGALPAISLVSQSAIATAFSNDVADDMVYAQLTYGYGKEGDVLIGISTSGNSKNVVNAVKIANSFGIKTICLTGGNGGDLDKISNVSIIVPEKETFKVQEYHLPVYHTLCAMIESEIFD